MVNETVAGLELRNEILELIVNMTGSVRIT